MTTPSAAAPMLTATPSQAPPPPATPPSTPSGAAQAGQNAADVLRKPRETIEGWGKGVAEFFNKLKAGNVIGGVLGMVGAWLIGSMFGAGPFQTILMVLLLPLGLYLGAKAAGDWSKDVAPPASNRGDRPPTRNEHRGREQGQGQGQGQRQGQRQTHLSEPNINVAMASLNPEQNSSIAFLNPEVSLGAPVDPGTILTPSEPPPSRGIQLEASPGRSTG
jgi:uncharacterized membrane protein